MSRKTVSLTYRTPSGKEVTEPVFLVDLDKPVFSKDGFFEFDLSQIQQDEYVYFEDNEGLFALKPTDVINIQLVN